MKRFMLMLATASLLILGGCGGDAPGAGAYEARIPSRSLGDDASGAVEVSLELKAGGEGSWTTRTEAAPVKWDVKDGTITLHGKSGGVMTGVLTEDGFRLLLPGAGEVFFVKKKK